MLLVTLILFSKALNGCIWYHNYARANRVELTANIYSIRLVWDSLIALLTFTFYFLSNAITRPVLVIILTLILVVNAIVFYTCVWRAHEKQKQKVFENSLRSVLLK